MRLSNDRDQEIIRSAISDSSASTISFLSALDNREAIVFGEGVATPMRFKFTFQESSKLPSAPGTVVETNPHAARKVMPMPSPDALANKLRVGVMAAGVEGSWVPAEAKPSLVRKSPLGEAAPNVGSVSGGLRPATTAAGTPLRGVAPAPTGLRPGGW
jgi:uncharacterized protein